MVAAITLRSLAWPINISSIWALTSLLWGSQEFWEIVEYVGGSIVIVGAVTEAMAELRHIPRNRKVRRKVVVISALTLILGLMIELFGLFRTSEISDLKVAQLNLEAGNANKQAGEATTRAGELVKQTAKLKKDNTILQLNLAWEQNERLFMKSQTEWRSTFGSPTRVTLINDLKKLLKDPVSIEYIRDNSESWYFANDLANCLAEAGVIPNKFPKTEGRPQPINSPGPDPLYGFFIVAGKKVPDAVLTKIADDLKEEGALGLAWVEDQRTLRSGNNDSSVTIIVGLNPAMGLMPHEPSLYSPPPLPLPSSGSSQ